MYVCGSTRRSSGGDLRRCGRPRGHTSAAQLVQLLDEVLEVVQIALLELQEVGPERGLEGLLQAGPLLHQQLHHRAERPALPLVELWAGCREGRITTMELMQWY